MTLLVWNSFELGLHTIILVSLVKNIGTYIYIYTHTHTHTHTRDSINWSSHIKYIIPKLSSACYIMNSIKPFKSLSTLKTIYCSYFNVILNYGLPFCGNPPHSTKIFSMQERIIRIVIGCKNGVSCRNLFRRLEIIPFVSQYIFSLTIFVVKNLFTLNLENHTKSTR